MRGGGVGWEWGCGGGGGGGGKGFLCSGEGYLVSQWWVGWVDGYMDG